MSNASCKAAVMDQLPHTKEIPARSPLYHQTRQAAPEAATTPGVYLWEDGLRAHLILRGDAEDAAFRKGIEAVTGMAMPQALQSATVGAWSLSWISPDEWLLLGPGDQAFAMETDIRDRLAGHYAVINVGGGQTLVRLSGPEAGSVLMKSCPYDVHESNFPPGKVVTTMLASSQATLRRLERDDWELVVRRSFADYVWRWLTEAANEYGLHIGAPVGH